jgi:rhamnopyranosyl-N-acetylglucosaminyl-diphospho-decaprenol beta-1,3/1,4-galactofuranosyltransferase
MTDSALPPKQSAHGAANCSPSIAALVLAFNSPETLIRVLRAIASQTRPPDAVVVVDNASDPPMRDLVNAWAAEQKSDVLVLEQAENSGPGGGWERALDHFRSSEHDLAWLLEDDIVAPPQCLAQLLAEVDDAERAYVMPTTREPSGIVTKYPAWHGVLLARRIVQAVGLPRADFFWWDVDTEYLKWRIPRAGFPERYVEQVVVEHCKGSRAEMGIPVWKYYYEARSVIYYHFHLRHGRGRWPRKMAGLMARAVIKGEPRDRAANVGMIVRGVVDGLRGRLGRRVEPVIPSGT